MPSTAAYPLPSTSSLHFPASWWWEPTFLAFVSLPSTGADRTASRCPHRVVGVQLTGSHGFTFRSLLPSTYRICRRQ